MKYDYEHVKCLHVKRARIVVKSNFNGEFPTEESTVQKTRGFWVSQP